MAVTYEPIATTTLGSAQSTITFSSIPNTYTDLRLIITAFINGDYTRLRFNSDTGTNYSRTSLYGNGTTAGSYNATNEDRLGLFGVTTPTTTIPAFTTVDIFNYTGSTFKTALCSTSLDKNGSGNAESLIGLWRSTSAITSITLLTTSTVQFATGTTATLYGILKA